MYQVSWLESKERSGIKNHFDLLKYSYIFFFHPKSRRLNVSVLIGDGSHDVRSAKAWKQ